MKIKYKSWGNSNKDCILTVLSCSYVLHVDSVMVMFKKSLSFRNKYKVFTVDMISKICFKIIQSKGGSEER